ncbi:MAG: lipid-A-disaccharide synthase [Planctomycetales bacterium]|nr:lipid-A-disaccharide synthase [Planctomycetales bacterium]
MKIFFSVGEPSGDLHGANLIRQLHQQQPGVQAVGYGGPRMAAAGCQLHADLTQLAVMWLLRVLVNLHRFWRLVSRADRYFRHQRPDAVVLIDYPGMNWWIARRAKAHGIPVFYYGTPQMWAWAGWRVRKMRRLVDHVLCKLPFEAQWYRQRGCRATFVGHPYFDEMQQRVLDTAFLQRQRQRGGPLVTILPGSRTQEVVKNLPTFLKAVARVQAAVPAARFAVASFSPRQATLARTLVDQAGLPVEVHQGRTAELIHLAHSCLACSGSVSLELLYHKKPTVIHYRVTPAFFLFVRLCRRLLQLKVKYITLVNMLADEPFAARPQPFDPRSAEAGRAVFPEFPTCTDKSDWLAHYLIQWLTDREAYRGRVERLGQIKAEVAHGGASRTAAAYILQQLAGCRRPVPRPHAWPPARWTRSPQEPAMADPAVAR